MTDIDFLKDYISDAPTLVMLAGAPGSGKSSTANRIQAAYPGKFELVSPDQIRLEITGDEADQSRNKEVFNKVYSRLGIFMDAGCNILYDATNCRPIHRRKILSFCRKQVRFAICIVINTPLTQCLIRNEQRSRLVPPSVIEHMYVTLLKFPPSINEGFDMVVSINNE